jgi:hypothetical protein
MPVNTLVAEPISIEVVITMEAAIRAMEAWHDDTYTSTDGDGFVVKSWDCRHCVMCQAMESMKAVINSIYTVYRPS